MTHLIQIDDVMREATPDEAAAIQAAQAASQELEAQQAAQEAAKHSVRNKLKALGLTDEEISALIP